MIAFGVIGAELSLLPICISCRTKLCCSLCLPKISGSTGDTSRHASQITDGMSLSRSLHSLHFHIMVFFFCWMTWHIDYHSSQLKNCSTEWWSTWLSRMGCGQEKKKKKETWWGTCAQQLHNHLVDATCQESISLNIEATNISNGKIRAFKKTDRSEKIDR